MYFVDQAGIKLIEICLLLPLKCWNLTAWRHITMSFKGDVDSCKSIVKASYPHIANCINSLSLRRRKGRKTFAFFPLHSSFNLKILSFT